MARIKKGDLVEVVRGRTSDAKKLAERNARRAAEGLEPLRPGDKGKRGRVIRVFPAEDKVLVEGINLKTRHVRQNAQGQSGGIETVERRSFIEPVSFCRRQIGRASCRERV